MALVSFGFMKMISTTPGVQLISPPPFWKIYDQASALLKWTLLAVKHESLLYFLFGLQRGRAGNLVLRMRF